MSPGRTIAYLYASFEIVFLVQNEEGILRRVALSEGISHHELCLSNELVFLLVLFIDLHNLKDQRFQRHC